MTTTPERCTEQYISEITDQLDIIEEVIAQVDRILSREGVLPPHSEIQRIRDLQLRILDAAKDAGADYRELKVQMQRLENWSGTHCDTCT